MESRTVSIVHPGLKEYSVMQYARSDVPPTPEESIQIWLGSFMRPSSNQWLINCYSEFVNINVLRAEI